MNDSDNPTPPNDLQSAGLELWNSLYAELEFGPHEHRLVLDACRVADIIDSLDTEASKHPMIVKGSTGQPVINPVIAEARVQRGLLANLLKALKVAVPEERSQVDRSAQARKAVNARWGKV